MKYNIIKNRDQIRKLWTLLTSEASKSILSFDLETTSKEEHLAKVMGISIAETINTGYYIVLREYDPETRTIKTLYTSEQEFEIIKEFVIVASNKKLIAFNGVYDIAVLFHNYEYDLTDLLFADPILMKHTLDEERPFGLKDIGLKEFGEGAIEEQKDLAENVKKKGFKWNRNQKDMWAADTDILAKYAIQDAILTLKIFFKYYSRLKKENLDKFFFKQEVMPLYKKATIPMKLEGVYIDVDYFINLKLELERAILDLEDDIYNNLGSILDKKIKEILDKQIAVTRTGQFAEHVLRYYELPVPLHKKTGKPTLAKSALCTLEQQYPGHKALKWLLWESDYNTVEVEKEVKVPAYKAKNSSIKISDMGDPIDYKIEIIKTKKKVQKDIDKEGNKEPKLPKKVIYEIKRSIYVNRNPSNPRIFNLSSTDHLSWLLFTAFKEKPQKFSRKTNKPKVDQDSLEQYKHLSFIPLLLKLKKLEKILNTYVKPIIEMQNNGWLYPSMLQFGTTSGRYACAGGLNLQTLPRFERPKKCPKCGSEIAEIKNNKLFEISIDCPTCKHVDYILDMGMIKRGFIAPRGYKVVNADFSALEPRIFSWVSKDRKLKKVWIEGLDLYSQIAIDVFGLNGVSADPKSKNFLKKVNPKYRQKSKVFTLAVVYGANAGRIASILNIDFKEAKEIINSYLDAYPGLKKYMKAQEDKAIINGKVQTDFGRVRHLPEAQRLYRKYQTALNKKDKLVSSIMNEEGVSNDEAKKLASTVYYRYRNLLNNAKNFPIQSTAAHVTNASLIKLAKLFKKYNIDGWICLQVHDEITCIVKDDQAKLAAKLLKLSMEKNRVTKKIDIPMIAEPIISTNFADAK